MLTAILTDSKVLASKAEIEADKLVALKSFWHWAGDIHPRYTFLSGMTAAATNSGERAVFGESAFNMGPLSQAAKKVRRFVAWPLGAGRNGHSEPAGILL